MRVGLLLLALVVVLPARASAEWQIKPFLGVTFDQTTTFALAGPVSKRSFVFGACGTLLGDVFGLEADIEHVPNVFESALILGSSATTLTGNFVIALPRNLTKYTLRPYFAAGGGLMAVRIDDISGALPISRNKPAFDVGGGVTGFVTDRIGVSWDVRWFDSLEKNSEGLSIGPEHLSYWRAYMALAIRIE